MTDVRDRVVCSDPAPAPPQLRRGLAVVAGHSRRPAARAALDAAIDLARRLGAELHVVHSATLDDYGIDPDTDDYEAERDRNLGRERADVLATLRATDLVWAYHEHHGDPALALARLADELDACYLVVGATHHGALRHVVGGAEPVVKRLLARQHRPVVVVPEPATEADHCRQQRLQKL